LRARTRAPTRSRNLSAYVQSSRFSTSPSPRTSPSPSPSPRPRRSLSPRRYASLRECRLLGREDRGARLSCLLVGAASRPCLDVSRSRPPVADARRRTGPAVSAAETGPAGSCTATRKTGAATCATGPSISAQIVAKGAKRRAKPETGSIRLAHICTTWCSVSVCGDPCNA
jgi:hypothetical protein